jgi:hypothetical protein
VGVLGDLFGEEGTLGFVGGQVERLPVVVGGLAGTADSAEQVGFGLCLRSGSRRAVVA